MTESKRLLPAMAAISAWMLVLSVLAVAGVLGGHYPAGSARIAVLLLGTLFAVAGLGLMLMRRWGWSLTLAAVFCSMCFGWYSVFHLHQGQWAVMAVINLIFFLYLVRPEVRDRLR
jgi:uncharacterized membrane protein (DUF2068 family)